jgi:hypothetical protein
MSSEALETTETVEAATMHGGSAAARAEEDGGGCKAYILECLIIFFHLLGEDTFVLTHRLFYIFFSHGVF